MFFRLAGDNLYIDMQVPKRMMQCPKAAEGIEETAWVTALRMVREKK